MVTLNTTAEETLSLNSGMAIRAEAYSGDRNTALKVSDALDARSANTFSFSHGTHITLDTYSYSLGATGKQLGYSFENRNNNIDAAQERARNAGTGIQAQVGQQTDGVAAAQLSKAYEFIAKQAQAAKDAGKIGLN